MLHRARRMALVYVEALGREVQLDPAIPIDDTEPEGAAIVAQWAHTLRSDSQIEQATAAPGEARSTRRKTEEAA